MDNIKSDFLQNVSNLLRLARKNVKTAVNLSMVYTYYEIGKEFFWKNKVVKKGLVMESI